ncbi:MAG: hypothetical protein Q9M94_05105 [Candidatus Gracilibacteria bacterium]|nr:hypothetical protein [Candidatus Gracilibacteria bacterium]
MKKILILLSLSILFVSCTNKGEEKIVLDEADKKIIEEVLDLSDTKTENIEIKTEEEVIKEMEKTEEVENTEKNPDPLLGTKEEVKVEEKIEMTSEEEEANNLLNELLGVEGDVNDVSKEISK